jgi:DnaJ like chaperone protein
MKYKNYSNLLNYFWVFIIIFLFAGGFRLLTQIFGAIIGLLINFLPLLIFGYIFYRLFFSIKKNTQIQDSIKTSSIDHQHFVELAVRIITFVIKADRKIEQAEIDSVLKFFEEKLHFTKEKVLWISDLLAASLKQEDNLDDICDQVNNEFSYEAKLILLDLIYRVAASDNEIVGEELKVIEKMVRFLAIPKKDVERISAQYSKYIDQDLMHLKMLGLENKTTDEEIKKAYREAAQKYHPDKVAHLGEEFKQMAEEKMREINKSYEYLTQK